MSNTFSSRIKMWEQIGLNSTSQNEQKSSSQKSPPKKRMSYIETVSTSRSNLAAKSTQKNSSVNVDSLSKNVPKRQTLPRGKSFTASVANFGDSKASMGKSEHLTQQGQQSEIHADDGITLAETNQTDREIGNNTAPQQSKDMNESQIGKLDEDSKTKQIKNTGGVVGSSGHVEGERSEELSPALTVISNQDIEHLKMSESHSGIPTVSKAKSPRISSSSATSNSSTSSTASPTNTFQSARRRLASQGSILSPQIDRPSSTRAKSSTRVNQSHQIEKVPSIDQMKASIVPSPNPLATDNHLTIEYSPPSSPTPPPFSPALSYDQLPPELLIDDIGSVQTTYASAPGAKNSSVQVALRIRPFSSTEKLSNNISAVHIGIQNPLAVSVMADRELTPGMLTGTSRRESDRSSNGSVIGAQNGKTPPSDTVFTFDHVYSTLASQDDIFHSITPLIDKFMEGFNSTTGSGKTYTMGSMETAGRFDTLTLAQNKELGVIPRAARLIFKLLEEERVRDTYFTYTVHVSFLELYNEDLNDLLATPIEEVEVTPGWNNSFSAKNPGRKRGPGHGSILIRETKDGSIGVTGLEERKCVEAEDILRFLALGSTLRRTFATNINAQSSRSHAIFSIHLVQQVSTTEGYRTQSKSSKFHFVDLAGSERLKRTNATGDRQKEGIAINGGLLALGKVISALADRESINPSKDKDGLMAEAVHIPYRNSKLTRILKDSLGGNSQTMMIACVSPSIDDLSETRSTMRYASRARHIKNMATVNTQEDATKAEQLKIILGRVHEELRAVRKISEVKINELEKMLRFEESKYLQSIADYHLLMSYDAEERQKNTYLDAECALLRAKNMETESRLGNLLSSYSQLLSEFHLQMSYQSEQFVETEHKDTEIKFLHEQISMAEGQLNQLYVDHHWLLSFQVEAEQTRRILASREVECGELKSLVQTREAQLAQLTSEHHLLLSYNPRSVDQFYEQRLFKLLLEMETVLLVEDETPVLTPLKSAIEHLKVDLQRAQQTASVFNKVTEGNPFEEIGELLQIRESELRQMTANFDQAYANHQLIFSYWNEAQHLYHDSEERASEERLRALDRDAALQKLIQTRESQLAQITLDHHLILSYESEMCQLRLNESNEQRQAIELLERQLAQMTIDQHLLQSYQSELISLRSQTSEQSDQLISRAEEIDSLRKQLEQQLAADNSLVLSYLGDINELRRDLSLSNNDIYRLKQEYAQLVAESETQIRDRDAKYQALLELSMNEQRAHETQSLNYETKIQDLLTDLMSHRETLKRMTNEHSESIESFEQKIEQLLNNIHDLETQIVKQNEMYVLKTKEAEDDSNKHKNECIQLESQISDLHKELERYIELYAQSVTSSESAAKAHQNIVNDYQSRTQQLSLEIESLKTTLQETRSEAATSSKQYEDKIKEYEANLREYVFRLEAKTTEYNNAMVQASVTAASHANTCRMFESQIKDLQERLDNRVSEYTKAVIGAENAAERHKLEIQKMEADIKAVKMELEGARKLDIQNQDTHKRELNESVTSMENRISEIQHVHSIFKIESENRIQELLKQCQEETRINQAKSEEISILETDLRDFRANLLAAKDNFTQWEETTNEKILDLENSLQFSQSELQLTKTQLQETTVERDEMLKNTEEEHEYYEGELSSARATLEATRTQLLAEIDDKRKSHEIQVRELESQIAKLNHNLEIAFQKQAASEESIAYLEQDLAQTQSKLAKTENEYNMATQNASDSHKRKNEEIARLNDIVNERAATIQRLEKSIEALQNKMEDMSDRHMRTMEVTSKANETVLNDLMKTKEILSVREDDIRQKEAKLMELSYDIKSKVSDITRLEADHKKTKEVAALEISSANDRHSEKVIQLNSAIEGLNTELRGLAKSMENLKRHHNTEIEDLTRSHQKMVTELKGQQEKSEIESEKLVNEMTATIKALKMENLEKVTSLRNQHSSELEASEQRLKATISEFEKSEKSNIGSLLETHRGETEALRKNHDEKLRLLQEKLEMEIAVKEKMISDASSKFESAVNEHNLQIEALIQSEKAARNIMEERHHLEIDNLHKKHEEKVQNVIEKATADKEILSLEARAKFDAAVMEHKAQFAALEKSDKEARDSLIEKHRSEVEGLQATHNDKIIALKVELTMAINHKDKSLVDSQNTMEVLMKEHRNQIEALEQSERAARKALEEKHLIEIQDLSRSYDEEVEVLKKRLESLISNNEKGVSELQAKIEALIQQHDLQTEALKQSEMTERSLLTEQHQISTQNLSKTHEEKLLALQTNLDEVISENKKSLVDSQAKIKALIQEHLEQSEALKQSEKDERNSLMEKHRLETQDLTRAHDERIFALKDEMQKLVSEHERSSAESQAKINSLVQEHRSKTEALENSERAARDILVEKHQVELQESRKANDEKLKALKDELNMSISMKERSLENSQSSLDSVMREHRARIEALEQSEQAARDALINKHKYETQDLSRSHDEKIRTLKIELDTTIANNEKELAESHAKIVALVQEHRSRIESLEISEKAARDALTEKHQVETQYLQKSHDDKVRSLKEELDKTVLLKEKSFAESQSKIEALVQEHISQTKELKKLASADRESLIEKHQMELKDLSAANSEKLASMKNEMDLSIANLSTSLTDSKSNIETLLKTHSSQIAILEQSEKVNRDDLVAKHLSEIEVLQKTYNEKICDLQDQLKKSVSERLVTEERFQNKLDEQKTHMEALDLRLNQAVLDLQNSKQKWSEEKNSLLGQLTILQEELFETGEKKISLDGEISDLRKILKSTQDLMDEADRLHRINIETLQIRLNQITVDQHLALSFFEDENFKHQEQVQTLKEQLTERTARYRAALNIIQSSQRLPLPPSIQEDLDEQLKARELNIDTASEILAIENATSVHDVYDLYSPTSERDDDFNPAAPLDVYESLILDLEARLADATAGMEQATRDSDRKDVELESLKQEIVILQNTLTQLQAHYEGRVAELKENQREIESLQTKLVEKEEETVLLRRIMQQNVTDHHSALSKAEEMRQNLEERIAQLNENANLKVHFEGRYNQLTIDHHLVLSFIDEQANKNSSEIAELKNSLLEIKSFADQDRAVHQQQLADLQVEILKTEKHADEEKVQFLSKVTVLEQQINDGVNAHRKEMQESKGALSKAKYEHKKDMDRAAEKVKALEESISKLKLESSTQTEKLHSLMEQIKIDKDLIAEQEIRLNQMTVDSHLYFSFVSQYLERIANLELEISVAKSGLESSDAIELDSKETLNRNIPETFMMPTQSVSGTL
ncbi:hypothetical protein HK096_001633 [Nowakowskiella sp. JEL0078]|nr:hypothetical protein HK096_001633 [Nowakowskiella sp. JEL0078]